MRLRARRDLQLDRPLNSRHIRRGAKRRQGRSNIDGGDQVVAVAQESRVVTNVDQDVEVAGRPTPLTGVPATCDTDPLPVCDPGRHVDRDLGSLHLTAPPPAHLAGLPGDPSVAVAEVADRGPDHLAERCPGYRSELARALAAGTGLDRSPRLGAVAMAALADGDGLVAGLDRGAPGSVQQIDVRGDCDVAALYRAARAAAAPAEDVTERAGSAERARSAEERVEDVGHGCERVEVRGVSAAAQPLVPIAVIGGAPLGIGEDLVGLGRLLELLLGRGVVAVDVRVKLPGQTAECPLDRRLVCVARDAENVVVVASGAHRSSYTSATKLDSWLAAS